MPQMIPVEDYVAQVLAPLRPLVSVELPLTQAHGLVLAEDVTAALPVPPWTNSAMDGYAVRATDTAGATASAPVVLPVAGDVPAGSLPPALQAGTAMRIMTGAMLPEGADAVVKAEDTDQQAGPHPLPSQVAVRARACVGLAVRRAGEDVAAGDPVLGAGTLLSATALSALASVGRARVRVLPRVRVAVVSTGSELVEPGEPLSPATVPDSNSLLLAGLVEEAGGLVTFTARAGDTLESLETVLAEAAGQADLVLTSGGVSAGAFDPLTMLGQAGPEHLHALAGADLSFAKVAMQPGKPQGHGTLRTSATAQAGPGREVPILMLPGNPVSVLVSFTLVVAPALARLGGFDGVATSTEATPSTRPAAPPEPVPARAAVAWRSPAGRRQYLAVRAVPAPQAAAGQAESPSASSGPADQSLWVAPTHYLGSGSHLAASVARAQALAVVPAEADGVGQGDQVRLLALPSPPVPGGDRLPVGYQPPGHR
nr:gephyrin-like molybdotransferase Glp [Actinomyces sp.]